MQKILKFFSCNLTFNNENLFRRAIVLNASLIITTLFFLFFFFFNLYFLHRESVALLNLIALVISIALFIYVKKSQNIALAAKISTLSLMIFLLMLIYYAHSDNFVLIWTIFLPIYSIFVNGKKIGLYFSLLFYAILFVASYLAIGYWEHGSWTIINWTRFVSASSLLLFAIYVIEAAYERYEFKLQEARETEAKLIKELSTLSITDPLTKLYNRRYYDTIIDKLISFAKRNKKCITFFILDIDFFKNYNDYYGHNKGDETLINIAKLVKTSIQRDDDFVFRLGGEEFAGVLISDDKEKSQQWIQGLSKKVEALKIEHKKSHCAPFVTVSIGICTKCNSQEFNSKDLYLAADKALYEAKLAGRNQTKIAS
jgi:diguanylate cyclase (GGDEF)-like protein